MPFKPTEVVVKRKVPYFALKVPQQYKLNSYKSYNVQEASSGYVPIKLPKPLRTGAEVSCFSFITDPALKRLKGHNIDFSCFHYSICHTLSCEQEYFS